MMVAARRPFFPMLSQSHREAILEQSLTETQALLDEAEEQLAYIGAGCVSATRDELVRRITAVGAKRYKAENWLASRVSRARAEAFHEIEDILTGTYSNAPDGQGGAVSPITVALSHIRSRAPRPQPRDS